MNIIFRQLDFLKLLHELRDFHNLYKSTYNYDII